MTQREATTKKTMTPTLQKHYIDSFLLEMYWKGKWMSTMDYTPENVSNLQKIWYKVNSISDKIEYYKL